MSAKKSTTAKKTAAKKSATKAKAKPKKTVKRPATKKASAAKTESFKLYSETGPFFTAHLRRETAYWLILGILAIVFSLWISHLHDQIQDLYDIVDKNIAEEAVLDAEYTQRLKEAKQK